MAVVTLHPVVIQFEGIGCSHLAVDKNLPLVINLKVVALIHLDWALIDREVLECELHALAFLRNPDRTIVIACPAIASIERIEISNTLLCVELEATNKSLTAL